MGDFDGKVALITGGGTGIGRATALQLAAQGTAVAVNYSRSRQEAEDTAAEIRAGGARALVVPADVADDAQVRAMVAATVAEFGRLDVLVNNAGRTRAVALADLEGIRDEDFTELFGVNFQGAFYCSRAAIPEMKRGGGGHIVNVGSIAGLSGLGSSLIYSASKAAVMNLTRGMAHSQAPEVQVNCVVPGLVETRWTATVSEEFARQNRESTPMGRVATADDVATAIVGLLRSAFITGASLVVDGGRTI
jgi:3-oxoacyl-[acyl-carrier protein] reductase